MATYAILTPASAGVLYFPATAESIPHGEMGDAAVQWQFAGAQPLHTGWAGLPAGLTQTLLGLVQIMETKDGAGRGHSTRVAAYGTQLARAAGLPQKDLPALEFGLLLHDVGKTAVSDQILQKPSRLTVAEYQSVKAHPAVGAWLLRPVFHEAEPRILDVVLHHHEGFDGSGYPDGLRGEAIPLWARICTIADAWDVMTSPRPYRSPLSVDQAIAELRRCSGTQFDPELAASFVDEVVPRYRSGLESAM